MADGSVKDRLLEAALQLFIAEGYEAVSVEKLRLAAGVSNGSFFHLFASKAELAAELLVLCVVDYQASVIARLRRAQTAAQGIEAIVSAHLRWVQNHREQAAFMLDEARSAWFAQAAGRLRQQNAHYLEAMERWRAPLLQRGELAPLPVEVFSAVLLGPANLLCRLWLTGLKPDAASPLRHEKTLVELAQRALIPDLTGPGAAQ
jgi:AcrR family transcriptional regulator